MITFYVQYIKLVCTREKTDDIYYTTVYYLSTLRFIVHFLWNIVKNSSFKEA